MGASEPTTGPPLRGHQRRWLRARAHELRPLVHVGESGVSQAVLSALDEALLDHELVKVRLHQPEDKRSTARILAEGVGAHLCGVVGHTVILYRPHPEHPRLTLPQREPASSSDPD